MNMAIRKFIEEMGEKILPARRSNEFRSGNQQQQFSGSSPGQQQATGQTPQPGGKAIQGGELSEASEAIRRHLLSRRGFAAPSDLVVLFDETDGVVIIGGTVRDEETRELIVETAGNIQGVEKVDDRMVNAAL
jgi:hypothetical protein